MTFPKTAALLLGVLLASGAQAHPDDDMPLPRNYAAQRGFFNEIGLGYFEASSLILHPEIQKHLWSASPFEKVPAYVPPPPGEVTLTNYETPLPHASQRMISRLEKLLLTAYLDRPSDVKLAKFHALYHTLASRPGAGRTAGSRLEHGVMADYFLSRALELGARERWLEVARRKVRRELEALAVRPGVTLEETRPAHAAFHDAMFYHEENRYRAAESLLAEYAARPNNVYTSFLLAAVNLWTGGEAGYDDPTVLYNFVLGSYFSERAIDLAQRAEAAWQANPANPRFRVASILGGFSVGHRRFLAKLANDTAAIQTLDAEHRAWYEINPVFHMFTVGYTLFEDDFPTAFDLWERGWMEAERPDLLTTQHRPRFTFNGASMFVGTMDFYLKAGELQPIREFWGAIVPFLPNFADWDLGPPAYQHRMANLEGIAALYANDDPSDDPMPFNVKRRKWGYNTMTCQSCHQTQRKAWTPEEVADVPLAPDDILTVGTWPAATTTWYGSSRR